jgi:four helix bundle protein
VHSTAKSAADGQDVRERSFAFACRVVRFCEEIDQRPGVGRLLVRQILDASTSFAARLQEARAAESRRDFVSKCSIGLKEARETWVRLRIVEACGLSPRPAESQALVCEANELVAIVSAIVRNTRQHMQEDRRRRPSKRP